MNEECPLHIFCAKDSLLWVNRRRETQLRGENNYYVAHHIDSRGSPPFIMLFFFYPKPSIKNYRLLIFEVTFDQFVLKTYGTWKKFFFF